MEVQRINSNLNSKPFMQKPKLGRLDVIVLVICALVIGVAIPFFGDLGAKTELNAIAAGLDAYQLEIGDADQNSSGENRTVLSFEYLSVSNNDTLDPDRSFIQLDPGSSSITNVQITTDSGEAGRLLIVAIANGASGSVQITGIIGGSRTLQYPDTLTLIQVYDPVNSSHKWSTVAFRDNSAVAP